MTWTAYAWDPQWTTHSREVCNRIAERRSLRWQRARLISRRMTLPSSLPRSPFRRPRRTRRHPRGLEAAQAEAGSPRRDSKLLRVPQAGTSEAQLQIRGHHSYSSVNIQALLLIIDSIGSAKEMPGARFRTSTCARSGSALSTRGCYPARTQSIWSAFQDVRPRMRRPW